MGAPGADEALRSDCAVHSWGEGFGEDVFAAKTVFVFYVETGEGALEGDGVAAVVSFFETYYDDFFELGRWVSMGVLGLGWGWDVLLMYHCWLGLVLMLCLPFVKVVGGRTNVKREMSDMACN